MTEPNDPQFGGNDESGAFVSDASPALPDDDGGIIEAIRDFFSGLFGG